MATSLGSIRSTLLLTAISLLAIPSAAPAQRHGRASRAAIVALEREWRQAVLSEDTQSMDRLLSDDFLGIMANGEVVTKIQQLDWMKSRNFVLTRLDLGDTRIKLISHHAAIVTSLARVDGSIDGRPLHGNFRYTRVYQRTPAAGWRITSFEATRAPARLADATVPGSPKQ